MPRAMTASNHSAFQSKIWLIALFAALCGVAVGFFWQTKPMPPQLSEATFLFPQSRPMPSFALLNHRGEAFTNQALQGKWSFLFFGYSHCPDICPTTLHTMNQVIQRLGEDARQTQFVLVTVDPERDTVERLAEYVPFFNPQIIGVTGQPEQVRELAQNLGVPFMKVENPDAPADYKMDHSARIFLVNPNGAYHALISPPFQVDQLVSDWRKMAEVFE